MKAAFKEIIQGDKPVVIDFYATWCGPCKAMAPIFDQAGKELGDKARFIKIDVDRNADLARTYNISSVPTLMVFSAGKIVHRSAGAVGLNQLRALVQKFAR